MKGGGIVSKEALGPEIAEPIEVPAPEHNPAPAEPVKAPANHSRLNRCQLLR
jgi:hypothetical protein